MWVIDGGCTSTVLIGRRFKPEETDSNSIKKKKTIQGHSLRRSNMFFLEYVADAFKKILQFVRACSPPSLLIVVDRFRIVHCGIGQCGEAATNPYAYEPLTILYIFIYMYFVLLLGG